MTAASITQPPDRRIAGMLLIVGSTAFFALAGIFTKSVTADAWTIACWRGFVGGALVTAYVYWARDKPLAERFRLGWRGWALALNGAISSMAFIGAFKHTYVANVAITYATAPFMAALIAWALRGERTRAKTLIAATLSLAGVAVMVGGGFGGGNLLGDGLALFMTALCALYLVWVRAWQDTPVVWAGAVAAFLVAGSTLFIGTPFDMSGRDALLTIGFGIAFACAVVLWTEGARLLPPAESGLLGSAEVPLAVFFSWLFLGELAPPTTFIGGAIVLASVFGYTLGDIYGRDKPAPAA